MTDFLRWLFGRREPNPPDFVLGAAGFLVFVDPRYVRDLEALIPHSCVRNTERMMRCMASFIGFTHGSLSITGAIAVPKDAYLGYLPPDAMMENVLSATNLPTFLHIARHAVMTRSLWPNLADPSSAAIDDLLRRARNDPEFQGRGV